MKKWNIFYSLICFLLCSCSEGCDEKNYDVEICNNSSEKIYYYYEFQLPSKGDTLKTSKNPYKSYYSPIEAGDKVAHKINDYSLYEGMQILFIKSSTMEKYDNKSFFEAEDICDKRYILTFKDLENMGFVIEYHD